jgi:hypothetical protein
MNEPGTPVNLIGHSRLTGPRIDRFQVYGERRSGTNFAARTIAQNARVKRWNAYGWKHGVPYFPIMPARCLFVAVVRDPFDWLRSFYAGPFEVDPVIAAKPFSEFLRVEWNGVFTGFQTQWSHRGYAVEEGVGRGETLFLDRHPLDGRPFRNVVEMRTVKLASHLSLLTRGLNAVAVRYEDFRTRPEATLREIGRIFDLRVNDSFVAVDTPVGPSSDRRSAAKTMPISKADREFILYNLDPAQEKRCGYLSTK